VNGSVVVLLGGIVFLLLCRPAGRTPDRSRWLMTLGLGRRDGGGGHRTTGSRPRRERRRVARIGPAAARDHLLPFATLMYVIFFAAGGSLGGRGRFWVDIAGCLDVTHLATGVFQRRRP
jgi:hypothetical protein